VPALRPFADWDLAKPTQNLEWYNRYNATKHDGLNLHIGSEEARPRVAAIVWIVEACRRLNIPVRDYLGSVLPGLANIPINRIAELMSVAWTARV
jgi:hypothetical protein